MAANQFVLTNFTSRVSYLYISLLGGRLTFFHQKKEGLKPLYKDSSSHFV
ncbi:hypothetical protein X560_1470 [Listeria fleischmannii 1991]|uniref:Uncharacterized protein n=1 Tax=Listeria fleischmannii 1991 TaxID=1430899 RepID=A0A0J8J6I8_9LIST|nr:hypothetical protein X560_1470 [Listeria fleischmannii 1991]